SEQRRGVVVLTTPRRHSQPLGQTAQTVQVIVDERLPGESEPITMLAHAQSVLFLHELPSLVLGELRDLVQNALAAEQIDHLVWPEVPNHGPTNELAPDLRSLTVRGQELASHDVAEQEWEVARAEGFLQIKECVPVALHGGAIQLVRLCQTPTVLRAVLGPAPEWVLALALVDVVGTR